MSRSRARDASRLAFKGELFAVRDFSWLGMTDEATCKKLRRLLSLFFFRYSMLTRTG